MMEIDSRSLMKNKELMKEIMAYTLNERENRGKHLTFREAANDWFVQHSMDWVKEHLMPPQKRHASTNRFRKRRFIFK